MEHLAHEDLIISEELLSKEVLFVKPVGSIESHGLLHLRLCTEPKFCTTKRDCPLFNGLKQKPSDPFPTAAGADHKVPDPATLSRPFRFEGNTF